MDLFKNTPYPIRSWSDFVEVGRFGLPPISEPQHLLDRIVANLQYYTANYIVVSGVLLLYTFVTNPGLFFALFLVLGIGAYIFFVGFPTQSQPPINVVIGGYALFSFLVLLYFSGFLFFYILFFILALVLLHAATRKRSIKAKVNNIVGSISNNIASVIEGDPEKDTTTQSPTLPQSRSRTHYDKLSADMRKKYNLS